jgi:hypothetical protein
MKGAGSEATISDMSQWGRSSGRDAES